MNPMFGLNQAG